jgi:hypothetical protein
LATERGHEEELWQPKIGREPEFNPFANALDRSGELENLPPLERSETGEYESIEHDRVAGKSTCTKASVAPAERGSTESATLALIEPAVRHAMIAQAAYFLSHSCRSVVVSVRGLSSRIGSSLKMKSTASSCSSREWGGAITRNEFLSLNIT